MTPFAKVLSLVGILASAAAGQVNVTLHHQQGPDTFLGPFGSQTAFDVPVDDSAYLVWIHATDPNGVDVGRVRILSDIPRSTPLQVLIADADGFPGTPDFPIGNGAQDWAGLFATDS